MYKKKTFVVSFHYFSALASIKQGDQTFTIQSLQHNLMHIKTDLHKNSEHQQKIFWTLQIFVTYLPVFVMIISVPRSWNLSQSSLVSRWHSTLSSSSQLHRIFVLDTTFSWTTSGDSLSFSVGSEPQSDVTGDCLDDLFLQGREFSPSEHSSTSTSMSSSSSSPSSKPGGLSLDRRSESDSEGGCILFCRKSS